MFRPTGSARRLVPLASPPEQPTEVLAGAIERVTFHNPSNGFCVLRIKARGHRDLVTVVGHAAELSVGEWVTVCGCWVSDREHGQQFKASFLRSSPPTTAEGIEKYLGSGMIRGIGFRAADAIAARLGIAPDAQIRLRAGINYALLEASGEGHCGLPPQSCSRWPRSCWRSSAPTKPALRAAWPWSRA